MKWDSRIGSNVWCGVSAILVFICCVNAKDIDVSWHIDISAQQQQNIQQFWLLSMNCYIVVITQTHTNTHTHKHALTDMTFNVWATFIHVSFVSVYPAAKCGCSFLSIHRIVHRMCLSVDCYCCQCSFEHKQHRIEIDRQTFGFSFGWFIVTRPLRLTPSKRVRLIVMAGIRSFATPHTVFF